MKCEEYFVLLCGHLDGMNDQNEEERLQAHLHSCEECRELLAQMRENDAALRENQEVPADLTAKIMQKVRKEPKKHKKRYWNLVTSGVAVAAVLAVVLLGGNGLRMPEESMKTEAAPAQEMEIMTEAAENPLTEQNRIVLRSAPMETASEYTYSPEPTTPGSLVTDEWFVSEDTTIAGGFSYSSSVTNPSVLFVFATEVKELDDYTALDLTSITLPEKAEECYRDLASEDVNAYCVPFLLLQQLKESYRSEYFEGSTEKCFVYIIPTT